MKLKSRFRPLRVLIIDDEPALTRVMKLILESAGDFEVRTENDSRRARAAALEFHPDIVLLDVMMPHSDGGDVARAFRLDPLLADVPIIFVSAVVARAESAAGLLRRGGELFLAKPTRRDTVLDSITKVLQPRAA